MKMKKVIIVQPLFISNASRCSDHTQKSSLCRAGAFTPKKHCAQWPFMSILRICVNIFKNY